MISVVPAAVIIPATYMLRQVYNQILDCFTHDIS
ncbi:Uncharacterised protein [Shigella sonnei]|nr:Uncharacterised protein [Shigella sonnei]